MIMVQQIITNAARDGARMAVLDGATTDGRDGVLTRGTETWTEPESRERV